MDRQFQQQVSRIHEVEFLQLPHALAQNPMVFFMPKLSRKKSKIPCFVLYNHGRSPPTGQDFPHRSIWAA